MKLVNRLNEVYLNELTDVSNEFDFNKLKNKKILISGSTGSVGSVLLDILTFNGIDTINIVHNTKLPSQFTQYRLEEFPDDIKFDYFINCAGNCNPKDRTTVPVNVINDNILLLSKLLPLSVKFKSSVIQLSSNKIYEFNSEISSVDCYAESKRYCELLLNSYRTQYGLKGTSLRIGHIISPYFNNRTTEHIYEFLKSKHDNKNITVLNPDKSFQYVYVIDVVRFILSLLFNNKLESHYDVYESTYTIGYISKLIDEMQVDSITDLKPNKINGFQYKYDIKTSIKHSLSLL